MLVNKERLGKRDFHILHAIIRIGNRGERGGGEVAVCLCAEKFKTTGDVANLPHKGGSTLKEVICVRRIYVRMEDWVGNCLCKVHRDKYI